MFNSFKQKGENMKKKLFGLLVATVPFASYANLPSMHTTTSKWSPRFFIEYDMNLYSESPVDIKLAISGSEDLTIPELQIKSNNRGNAMYMGADFNGIQVGLRTSSSSGFNVKATLPFFDDWRVNPFLTAEVGVSSIDMEIEGIELNDTNLTYAFGLGFRYDICNHFYAKLGAKYEVKKYDIALDLGGEGGKIEAELDGSGMSVMATIGYRF